MPIGCPIPHKTRDQVWLIVGAALTWFFLRNRPAAPLVKRKREPCVVDEAARVVNLPERTIDEFFGNPSTGTSFISIAQVCVKKACEEPPQTPQFDEYVLVLEGVMQISVGGGNGKAATALLEAKGNQALFLPRGQRYTYIFPGPCRYVPVCIPGFSPDNCGRE